jgi:hypothetical protein
MDHETRWMYANIERTLELKRADRLASLGYTNENPFGFTARLWRVLTSHHGHTAVTAPAAPEQQTTPAPRPLTPRIIAPRSLRRM